MMRKSKAAIITDAAFATVSRRIATVRPVVQCPSPYGTGNVLPFAYQLIAPQKDKIWDTEGPVQLRDGSASPLGSCDTPVSRPLWC